jgi:hypothetical protein
MDPMQLTIVFDPACAAGPAWASMLSRAFSTLGMQRDNLSFSVPVQQRSAPWHGPQADLADPLHPRRLDLATASCNCVLVLVDTVMTRFHQARWAEYMDHIRRQMTKRPGRDIIVPILLQDQTPAFLQSLQGMRPSVPDLPADARARTRFFVQLLNALLVHRQAGGDRNAHEPGHGIFVSHAKRDGEDTARRIVEVIADVKESLGPRCFFDKGSLLPGDDYPERFEQAISHGSLLAVVTDAYHTRPWCRWEMLTAKRLGRPVVAADLTAGRIERTYPYLGNVPSVRVSMPTEPDAAIPDHAVELITSALLAEALRDELWRERASTGLAGQNVHLLPRPPELADVVELVATNSGREMPTLVYPDPPLGAEEMQLLQRAFPKVAMATLTQAGCL